MSNDSLVLISPIDGFETFYNVISLVFETLFYGIHLLLLPFGFAELLKRGHGTRPKMHILFAILIPFLLSTIYWVLQFAAILVRVQIFLRVSEQYTLIDWTYYMDLINAIVLINYLVSDAVVVWRAWVLCKDEFGRILYIPICLFMLMTLFLISTICFRVASYFTAAGPNAGRTSHVIEAITISQISFSVSSFLTNVAATSIVSLKAWRHRQVLRAGLRDAPNRRTRGEQILVLLMESGLLYCASGIILLAFLMVKLPGPWGTVGDVYNPISLQCAGMYPMIVILLISMQRPEECTLRWQLSTKASRPVGGTLTSPTVPGRTQLAAARSVPSNGRESGQNLDVDIEPGAESLPTRLSVHSYAQHAW